MSYYPALKQRLTCREVAPRYGLKVNAAGMTLCPFHGERSPSLKLSRGFCCFGCGAQGDVITFVSRLFEIPPGEAAQKLSADFGIPVGDHLRCPPAVQTEMETWVPYAKEILHSYYDLLLDWKRKFCPKAPDKNWHPSFTLFLFKRRCKQRIAKQETRAERASVNCAEIFLRPFTPVRQQTAPRYLPQGKQRVWKTAKKFPLPCEKCANKR